MYTVDVSILYIMLCLKVASASEFDVGAGFEVVGYARPGEAAGGLGQVELDARLRLGPLGFRTDLDLVPPGPLSDAQRVHKGGLTVFPEWAAVMMGTGTGWLVATGFQPSPVQNEGTDGWLNPAVPYTLGFSQLWPGYFLGLRGQATFADGWLSASFWGGANSSVSGGAAPQLGSPVFGANAVLGRRDGLPEHFDARAGLAVFPVEREGRASASVRVPVKQALALWGDAWLGFGGGLRGSFATTVVILPASSVHPIARGEWSGGLGGSPWIVDAGVVWHPFDSLRFTFTGRMNGDTPWGFVGVSLMDDVEPGPGWDFR